MSRMIGVRHSVIMNAAMNAGRYGVMISLAEKNIGGEVSCVFADAWATRGIK